MKAQFIVFFTFFVVLTTAQNSTDSDDDDGSNLDWDSFKALHNKTFNDDVSDSVRKTAFLHSQQVVLKHNAKAKAGNSSFTIKLNKLADYTPSEYAQMNGLKIPKVLSDNETLQRQPIIKSSSNNSAPTLSSPASVDWRTSGRVTRVKNQKQCGDCWAFASTGALEGQKKKKSGKLIAMSEQNLLDCSTAYGNSGCDGGWMGHAFDYIKAKGINRANQYPYKAVEKSCRYKPAGKIAGSTGSVYLPAGDENALMDAVASIGPIAVGIDASHSSFQLYSSGVYYEPACDPSNIDHAVLVVGYGTDPTTGEAYWLVKNSWGKSWGENGYIRMARNRNNNCGIASWGIYPTI